jgi:hypothetical protein
MSDGKAKDGVVYQENEISPFREGVRKPQLIEGVSDDCAPLGVFCALGRKVAALFGLLEPSSCSLLERRVGAKDDPSRRGERRADDRRRPNEPAYTPSGGGERLCR